MSAFIEHTIQCGYMRNGPMQYTQKMSAFIVALHNTRKSSAKTGKQRYTHSSREELVSKNKNLKNDN